MTTLDPVQNNHDGIFGEDDKENLTPESPEKLCGHTISTNVFRHSELINSQSIRSNWRCIQPFSND
jgi:hypothetical protein